MNFQDLEHTANPYPLYATWRQETPIWWAEDVQGWVLSRYEDVRAVLKNPSDFSSAVAPGRAESTMSPAFAARRPTTTHRSARYR